MKMQNTSQFCILSKVLETLLPIDSLINEWNMKDETMDVPIPDNRFLVGWSAAAVPELATVIFGGPLLESVGPCTRKLRMACRVLYRRRGLISVRLRSLFVSKSTGQHHRACGELVWEKVEG